ncbi:MAG: hypothetical protein V2I46_04995 [Bacteroides sp.]|jgi:hypothetical protein|nr:hypothetical protein [Bacteroides sp.]
MEDFVYIILVIAWLVVSIMKRKSKNQAPAKPTPASRPQQASPPREFDLEEALKEMFGGKPASKPEPAPEPVAQRAPAETVFENQEPEYESMAEELSTYQEPVYQTIKAPGSVPEEYQFSTEVRDQTIEDLIRANAAEEARLQAAEEMLEAEALRAADIDFDARKAVIFSEIINRKYS